MAGHGTWKNFHFFFRSDRKRDRLGPGRLGARSHTVEQARWFAVCLTPSTSSALRSPCRVARPAPPTVVTTARCGTVSGAALPRAHTLPLLIEARGEPTSACKRFFGAILRAIAKDRDFPCRSAATARCRFPPTEGLFFRSPCLSNGSPPRSALRDYARGRQQTTARARLCAIGLDGHGYIPRWRWRRKKSRIFFSKKFYKSRGRPSSRCRSVLSRPACPAPSRCGSGPIGEKK